jgi:alpha-glucosidase
MSGPSLADPHHDGSELYVPAQPAELGDEVVVRLRVPRSVRVGSVALRYVQDGEPWIAPVVVEEETATETWWRASFRAANRQTRYRWLLSGGDVGYAWVTGSGISRLDLPDADDFVVTVDAEGPEWHASSVVYEVFPDRFASAGGRAPDLPDWAVPRGWDEAVSGRNGAAREWFGGDLAGVEAHLDHIESLGANVLYLTPIFPAGSSHRYDAISFDRVDPLLGGDAALASLIGAAHARGMRVVGDLTLNHCGVGHEWFRSAQDDPSSPERDFFLFDDGVEHGYQTWLGVATLPKLDHRSPELRRRLTAGPDSVVRRWLGPEGFDGWRIDVANMTGRHGETDLHHDVARSVREAVEEALPDALLLAEHGHDTRGDLRGDGWHGVMNYMGFLRPVWAWLRADALPDVLEREFFALPVGVPRADGHAVVESMQRFRAGVNWPAVINSWVLLDSHDTARFGVVAGSRERHAVGIGLQMTSPGVPMVWAGDEIGLGGEWGEDARRTMPWGHPETWDTELLAVYRRLIALRRSSRALARGGIRYAHVDADAIVYLRETADERVLCLARRREGERVRLSLESLGCRTLDALAREGAVGEDVLVDGTDVVLPGEGPAFQAWRIE